jgi:hypothetical protein
MMQWHCSTNEQNSPAGAKTARACHQSEADSKKLVFLESSKKMIKISVHESCVRQKKFSHFERRLREKRDDLTKPR